MRPPEAAFAFGSEKLFMECVVAGWISPVVQRHKLKLFDAGDVAQCWARILRGELPVTAAKSVPEFGDAKSKK